MKAETMKGEKTMSKKLYYRKGYVVFRDELKNHFPHMGGGKFWFVFMGTLDNDNYMGCFPNRAEALGWIEEHPAVAP